MKFSGADLQYLEKEKNERFTPAVVESSGGIDRTILALICDAYHEEEVAGETRVVLRFNPKVAPVKIAVLPLSKKPELCEPARAIERTLRPHYETFYDETQSIGKRYRRMDEVGTPYAITFDFDSIQDKQVTVRERDSLKQVRLPIDNLLKFFEDLFRRGSWE